MENWRRCVDCNLMCAPCEYIGLNEIINHNDPDEIKYPYKNCHTCRSLEYETYMAKLHPDNLKRQENLKLFEIHVKGYREGRKKFMEINNMK